jgi:hypothetical protein
MTGEQNIDYEALAHDALRCVVRTVLRRVARSGLPGQHHFYIAFNTNAAGASVSSRLKEKYPEEMTIVLQHRFWDLTVKEDRFEVNLTFNGIPERLVVPFAAIRVFFDPSVPYGLQFEGSDLAAGIEQAGDDFGTADAAPHAAAHRARKGEARGRPPAAARAEKKPRGPRKPRASGKGTGSDAAKGKAPSTPAPRPGGAGTDAPKLVTSAPERPDVPANDTKVIQLDQFRRK